MRLGPKIETYLICPCQIHAISDTRYLIIKFRNPLNEFSDQKMVLQSNLNQQNPTFDSAYKHHHQCFHPWKYPLKKIKIKTHRHTRINQYNKQDILFPHYKMQII